jgi:hypothetical protein
MSYVTVRLPATTLLTSLRALADDINCDLRLAADGAYVFRQRECHGNSNVIPIQRRRGQLSGLNARSLPQPPAGDTA